MPKLNTIVSRLVILEAYFKYTRSFTSCSPVVRALLYQPRGPKFDSWHFSFRVSNYKVKNQNDATATFVNYVLILEACSKHI
jgi:hypothetical protein